LREADNVTLRIDGSLVEAERAPPASTAAFVRELRFEALPADVVGFASRCLLDLAGTAAGGTVLPASRISRNTAVAHMGGVPAARVLFDGRSAGLAGAAFAGAATIDALDAHDGHVLTKGHAGVAVLPALLAFSEGRSIGSREFLACLVLGYEIATRAGIALHASVPDFHCSGAWNALGAAAVGARLLGLDEAHIAHAFGIAEYWGPRGQIMRVCESPTMLKDGSSWGAHAGVLAALVAADGFTGAPAVTVERQPEPWRDLGTRWRIREQYFKAYPVCRWAQPAIEGALALRREHGFAPDDIASIAIESFREAVDLGSRCAAPAASDEAQYSLPYPVAAALVHGDVGAREIDAAGRDAAVDRLLSVLKVVEAHEFSQRFPAERWARVRIVLRDGRDLVSAPAQARGGPENPLGDDEIAAKFHALADPVFGVARAMRIESLVRALVHEESACDALRDELLQPIH
jgi:2-methylcitrate dehydratase PrpD